MRRLLIVTAVLFSLLAMHGGLGVTGCATMSSAADTSMAGMPGMSATNGSGMALHHTPAAPSGPLEHHSIMDCISPLPQTSSTWSLGMLFTFGLLLLALTAVRPRQSHGRPSTREPPLLRWLDPVIGLGVLRA
jgi:hypothetical protein